MFSQLVLSPVYRQSLILHNPVYNVGVPLWFAAFLMFGDRLGYVGIL